MPADAQVTSQTVIGGDAHHGPVAFTTTHWSVVLEAQGESPAAQEALEKLCRTYWRPIYGFIRRQGVDPEEAKDLTQGFFALLLERRGQHLIPLEDLRDRERIGFETSETLAADQIYERRWALSVLDQVLARLEEDYRASGNVQLFDRLQKSLTDEPDRVSAADTARELGTTESAVRQASYRLRLRYRQLLREEIAHTVMAPRDIDDELRHLVAVLRA